jgi:hypothetical protein
MHCGADWAQLECRLHGSPEKATREEARAIFWHLQAAVDQLILPPSSLVVVLQAEAGGAAVKAATCSWRISQLG